MGFAPGLGSLGRSAAPQVGCCSAWVVTGGLVTCPSGRASGLVDPDAAAAAAGSLDQLASLFLFWGFISCAAHLDCGRGVPARIVMETMDATAKTQRIRCHAVAE